MRCTGLCSVRPKLIRVRLPTSGLYAQIRWKCHPRKHHPRWQQCCGSALPDDKRASGESKVKRKRRGVQRPRGPRIERCSRGRHDRHVGSIVCLILHSCGDLVVHTLCPGICAVLLKQNVLSLLCYHYTLSREVSPFNICLKIGVGVDRLELYSLRTTIPSYQTQQILSKVSTSIVDSVIMKVTIREMTVGEWRIRTKYRSRKMAIHHAGVRTNRWQRIVAQTTDNRRTASGSDSTRSSRDSVVTNHSYWAACDAASIDECGESVSIGGRRIRELLQLR